MFKQYAINPSLDMETMQWSYPEGFAWHDDKDEAKFDRAANAEAKQAQATAATNAAAYGSTAATEGTIGENYDVQQLTHPTGFGQQGTNQMLTAAQAGTGGAAAGLTGLVSQAQARRGAAPASTVGDALVRQRQQEMAGASEKVAAADVGAKMDQQSQAASRLSQKYGVDVNAQLGQGNLQNSAINTQLKSDQVGWFQNLMSGISTVAGVGKDLFGGAGGAGMFAKGGAFGS